MCVAVSLCLAVRADPLKKGTVSGYFGKLNVVPAYFTVDRHRE